jgi:CubicO group peptidase (beta-lactamase class C family)
MKSKLGTRQTNRKATVVLISVWILLGAEVGAAQEARREPGNETKAALGATVDACVQDAMSQFDIPGLAVAVVDGGEIAYERGYGVKHRDLGGAVDEHTLFRHGSVGKMFTAAAILRLVDQGVVDLSDPVTEYVPELHFAPGLWSATQMRVRNLIDNTAGIPSYRSSPEGTLSDWVLTLDEVPLLGRPGAFFNYSNSNFALADLVVERASGMSFNDYVEAEIYRPAGMVDSTRHPSMAVANGNFSFGHADQGQIYAPDDYVELVDGFTSAHDLARWAQVMMSKGAYVLSGRSSALAQTPRAPLLHYAGRPTSIGGGAYGFGLFVDEYPDGQVVWHSGGIPGWVTYVGWVPGETFAVAILANSWPNAFNGAQQAYACILENGIDFTMPDMSEPSDPSTWSRYADVYDAVYEDGFEFEVVVEYANGELLMIAPDPNNPAQRITRTLENIHASTFRFWANQDYWLDMTFVPGKGEPAPVRWLRNQRVVGLRRLSPHRATVRR